ncbi:MAG: MFS transporter [Chloroflexota bacterium]
MSTSYSSTRAGYWVLATTIAGASMSFIDGSVVNIALPAIQQNLDASVTDIQWIVGINALMIGALVLVGGALGDRFGRRRIYAIGVALFGGGSVACGLVNSADQMIWFRGLQGIGGALLVPGSLAIVSSYFADENRGWAIGTWSGFTALTTALGPVIAGWFIENLSWRWVFFINLPLMIITLILLFRFVPESYDEEAPDQLDWIGAGLATAGLGGIVFAFIEASSRGWGDWLVISAAVIGGLGVIAFVIAEGRVAHPMMPLTLFQSPTFSGANLFTLLLYGALGSTFFFLPLNLIQLQGYSAVAAGAAFLPAILLIFSFSGQSGRLADRFGTRPLMVMGGLLVSAGFALFALQGVGGSYWTTFFWPIIVLGFGLALMVPPLTTAVMSAVDARYSGIASAINNAMARVAGLLAIAILGYVLLTIFNDNLDIMLAGTELPDGVLQILDEERARMAAAEMPESIGDDLKRTLDNFIKTAFLIGYRRVMWINAALAALASLVAWLSVEIDLID